MFKETWKVIDRYKCNVCQGSKICDLCNTTTTADTVTHTADTAVSIATNVKLCLPDKDNLRLLDSSNIDWS